MNCDSAYNSTFHGDSCHQEIAVVLKNEWEYICVQPVSHAGEFQREQASFEGMSVEIKLYSVSLIDREYITLYKSSSLISRTNGSISICLILI